MASLLLRATILLMAGAPVAAQTYTFAWSDVPATAPTVNSYDALGGNTDTICPCDLNANKCDWQCCCDTADCASSAINMFSHCESYANTTDRAYSCMNSGSLHTTNARGDISVSSDSEGRTCASLDWGSGYYQNPGTVSTTAEWQALFDSYSLTPKRYNFTAAKVTPMGLHNRGSGVYAYGDPIIAHVTSSKFTTFLKLPSKDSEGTCLENSAARFMLPTRNGPLAKGAFAGSNETCWRYASLLETECVSGGLMDASTYVSNIEVAASYNAAAWGTGCCLTLANGNASITTWPPTPSWDSTNKICSNGFAGLLYDFTVDSSSGAIATTKVMTFLNSFKANHFGQIWWEQRFGSVFHLSTESTPTVTRSGNNGYIPGMVVLSGTRSTSGSAIAISQTVGGLVVPSTYHLAVPSHTCMAVSLANSSIYFETPSSSCCMVSYTVLELQTACSSSHVPTFPISAGTYIGIYGSADRYRVEDWMLLPDPVVPSSSTYDTPRGMTAPFWDEATSTCYGILGGSLRLEFEWTYQGGYAEPQRRIVAARQVWERQTWRWENPQADSTHRFPICVKTAWTEKEAGVPETAMDRGHDAGWL